jgi:ubiquinone/menaquinone biosynthesis C-methylase UbiE
MSDIELLKSRTSSGARSTPNTSSAFSVEKRLALSECDAKAWEAAYQRFETPAQEMRKFARRLMKMGSVQWARDAKIMELFCGRGNGLRALSKLGFIQPAGGDLSASLLGQYVGPANVVVCDGRQLPFHDRCRDIVIIQGGLHHLPTLPDDLEQTLAETHRVLRPDGLLVIVEPWMTPFLALVHRVCKCHIARRLSRRIDALAAMIYYEQQTYEQWLSRPQTILGLFEKYFQTDWRSVKWGKLSFVGRKRLV